jgi:hypothetical protein
MLTDLRTVPAAVVQIKAAKVQKAEDGSARRGVGLMLAMLQPTR